ncbi:MAG: glycosyltransferase [Lachnospiraceae bacterium]|nr:glycosyltransferase [Lachnospiraceae bacterium]
MNNKVSIIIPCYNVAPFVDRCLESILDQTCGTKDLEIILVDDASTDDTLSHLEKFESAHPEQTILIKLERNSKQGAARNIGIKYSTGRYITFVDADDIIYPRMIESLVKSMEEYDCDIVECGFDSFTDKRNDAPDSAGGSRFYDLSDPDNRREIIFKFFRTAVWGRLYRADFIKNNDIVFPENSFYEDNYFSGLCMILAQKYCVVDEILYSYYLNEKGTMHSAYDPEKTKQEIPVMDMYLKELEKRGIYDDVMKNNGEELEYFAVWKSYLDPLRMMLNSGSTSEEIFAEANYYAKYVRSVFPDAAKNKYLMSEDRFISFARDLLLMV